MQPELAKAAVDTEALIKKVTADQLAADEQQAIVEKDVEEANKVAANVQVIKDDCQKVSVEGCGMHAGGCRRGGVFRGVFWL